MKRMVVFAIMAAFCSTAAMATDLHVMAESGGATVIDVGPGDNVEYAVLGKLTDDTNEGLALVGFDLVFTGGDLTPANAPTSDPMRNFVTPQGLTNPAGYGGTLQSGDLIQCGGGQNTIMNGTKACVDNDDCPTGSNCDGGVCDPVADFPIGTVFTGIGQPRVCTVDGDCPLTAVCRGGACWETLVTGSLTAPTTNGTYTLQVNNVFANVIREFETGIPFWATEAAGVGTVTSLTINVAPPGVALIAEAPDDDNTLWRSANNTIRLTFNGDIIAPGAGEVTIQEMLAGGGYGPDLSTSFAFAVEVDGGGQPRVLKMVENGTVLNHRTWYAVRHNGWGGVAAWADDAVQYVVQVGDANEDGRVQFNDLAFINAAVPTDPAADDAREDINGDGRVQFNDLSAANSSIPSDTVAKPAGHS